MQDKLIIKPKKLIAFLIPILPLLNMYKINFIFNGLAEFVSVLIAGLIILHLIRFPCVVLRKTSVTKSYANRSMFLLLILWITSFLNIDNAFNFRSLIFISIVFLILFGCYMDCVDLEYFKKVYITIAFVASIYIILQYTIMFAFHIYLPANILPFPVKGMFDSATEYYSFGRIRAQSFFSEPAVYAQYVLPAYGIILFSDKNKRKKIVFLAVLTIGLVLSTSSTGILCAVILWLFYIWKEYRENFVKVCIVLLVFVCVFLFIYNRSQYINESINEILFSSTTSGKTTTRIFRGFAVYQRLPFINKMIGTGVGNGDLFISRYSIVTPFESAWGTEIIEYFNTIASCFIYGGFICGLTYIFTQMSFFNSKNLLLKALAVMFLLMSASSSIFFNVNYLLYGTIFLCVELSPEIAEENQDE